MRNAAIGSYVPALCNDGLSWDAEKIDDRIGQGQVSPKELWAMQEARYHRAKSLVSDDHPIFISV
jgi:hypothetical protein